MMTKLARRLLLSLLVVCVPAQAAAAVSAGQHAALEQCHHDGHDGQDGHAKHSGTHCHECCTAGAISGVIRPLLAAPEHGAVLAAPDFRPGGDSPDGIDRPPRTAL